MFERAANWSRYGVILGGLLWTSACTTPLVGVGAATAVNSYLAGQKRIVGVVTREQVDREVIRETVRYEDGDVDVRFLKWDRDSAIWRRAQKGPGGVWWFTQ